MSGRRTALTILLAVQTALSAAAVAVEWSRSCAACFTGLAPGAAGIVLYGGLLGVALTRGPSLLLYGGILFAFGVHAALAAQMILSGILCGICLAATAGSILLVVLSIALDRANLGRLAMVAPWSALLVAATSTAVRPAIPRGPSTPESVDIVVFTQEDCSYCDELRDRVMPEIEKEFGMRVKVRYRPAADLPAVRRTPTLILTPGRAGVQGRVIEGLPTVERLRGAIRDLEIRS